MLDNLAKNTTITTTDDENSLGVGVRVHAEVGDHLLVGELIALGGLDDVVENENGAIVGGLEDQNILVLALLVVQDLFDLEGHGLACLPRISIFIPTLLGRMIARGILPGHMSEISLNQPSISYSLGQLD